MAVLCLLILNDFPAKYAIYSFHDINLCNLYLTFKRLQARVEDLLCRRIIKRCNKNKRSFMKRSEKLQQVRNIWGQS